MDEQNLHQEQDAVDYQDGGRESIWQCKFIYCNSVNFYCYYSLQLILLFANIDVFRHILVLDTYYGISEE
jgi:hypothetical protein